MLLEVSKKYKKGSRSVPYRSGNVCSGFPEVYRGYLGIIIDPSPEYH